MDDVTVYRQGPDAFFLCVNAANIDKDREWLEGHCGAQVPVRDRSEETALLALQGPASAGILAAAGAPGAGEVRRFGFSEMEVAGALCTVSRTGYTGSDGFELYLDAADAEAVFRRLLESGAEAGLEPAGLGARDTLRLEAALPLYGHELDDDTSPLEAGLDRFLKSDKAFVGRESIAARGISKRLVGFVLSGRGVARADYAIHAAGEPVGRVTSGAPSPTLGKSIGLGYVPPAHSAIGTALEVMVRDRAVEVLVVETPFLKGGKGG